MQDAQLIQNIRTFCRTFEFDLETRVPCQRTSACLSAFLALNKDIGLALEQLDIQQNGAHYRADYLEQIGWKDAAALLVNTFYRSRRDQDFDDLAASIADTGVAKQIEHFLDVVDQDGVLRQRPVVSQIMKIRDLMIQWGNEGHRPEPKPLIFVFDDETLEKVLSRKKTCLRTPHWNGDTATGSTGVFGGGIMSYGAFVRGATYRERVEYAIGQVYPVYANDSDEPSGHIRIRGIDKDDLHTSMMRDSEAVREGFSGNARQSPLDQFLAWWDANHPDESDKWHKNPRVWVIYFSLQDTPP